MIPVIIYPPRKVQDDDGHDPAFHSLEEFERRQPTYFVLSRYAGPDSPGPRYRTEEGYSGQEFREDVLEPALRDGKHIYIDIDIPCTSSFLEEVFGGLIRSMGIDITKSLILRPIGHSRTDKAIQYLNAAIEKEAEKNAQVSFSNNGGYRDGALIVSKMLVYKPHLRKEADGILRRQTCRGPLIFDAWNKKEWTCDYCGKLWTRHSTSLFGGRERIWWPSNTPGMYRYGP